MPARSRGWKQTDGSNCITSCADAVGKYLSEQDAYKLEKVEPVLSDDQLDNAVKPIIQEYLEHGDTAEVEVGFSTWFL